MYLPPQCVEQSEPLKNKDDYLSPFILYLVLKQKIEAQILGALSNIVNVNKEFCPKVCFSLPGLLWDRGTLLRWFSVA